MTCVTSSTVIEVSARAYQNEAVPFVILSQDIPIAQAYSVIVQFTYVRSKHNFPLPRPRRTKDEPLVFRSHRAVKHKYLYGIAWGNMQTHVVKGETQ